MSRVIAAAYAMMDGMPRYVALLRGVNVGGKAKVSMAELRALFESLGHREVVTYIQSGNIVFTTGRAVTAKRLEAAIAGELGIDTTVVVRTRSELERVVKNNPFPKVDTTKLHVGFMAKKPAAAVVAKIDADRFAPDEFAVRGCDLYLHLPNGMGRSKLPPYLDRQLKIPTTVRNWNTVTKLLELAAER
jgi:uncharacterized protein (DUF1697 family)